MIAAVSPSAADTDVLIVGAGPAGATAARTLACAGVRVRLVDRAGFPRNKPCGGCISLRVLTRFPYLERALARFPPHVPSRLYLEGPDGHATVIESDGPAALMIRRVEFDALLVSLAVEAGAELLTGPGSVHAEGRDEQLGVPGPDGRPFSASLRNCAAGGHSVGAPLLGLTRRRPARRVSL